jgi:hypothetical protein
MPTKPNFHPVLQLQTPTPESPTEKPGAPAPHAGGFIADGDELLWVYVWIIQNGDDMNGGAWAAAADGESPDGKTFKGEWEVETHMSHDSDDFKTEIAAVGTAMALIKRADNSHDVYWWTDAVNLERPEETSAT